MGSRWHRLLPSIPQPPRLAASILWLSLLGLGLGLPVARAQMQVLEAQGRFGGEMVVPTASEPQSFNPVFALDSASQLLSSLTMADLMHINPRTLEVEPALATSVEHSTDRRWIIHLRRGVRFSDGSPFTADDVVFSFQVYTDPKLDAPERALLTFHGQPIRCRALSPLTVELDSPAPIAVGDRVFDSVWMLPRHLLQAAYQSGHLDRAWALGTAPGAMAGLGPFRLAAFHPGQDVQLARNPHYWRSDAQGRALPFLDGIRLRMIADPNLRLTLFARGQVDGLDTLGSADYTRLRGNACCQLLDAGAGLNAEVLVVNMAPDPPGAALPARAWFRQTAFRQALSQGLDRANLVRNVYAGKASPLASLTSPSDRRWADPTPPTAANPARALARLTAAGFHLRQDQLYDSQNRPVKFSLIVPASNAARMKTAVFLQEDLRRLGMAVQVVPLDFSSYLDRLMHRDDFEAALVGIQITDADPNAESLQWTLDGSQHFWNLRPAHPAAWEVSLDQWFRQQVETADPALRLRLYRRIQDVEHRQLPLIPLVAPDVLIGARAGLQGVRAAVLAPHLLWNADQLYWPTQGRR